MATLKRLNERRNELAGLTYAELALIKESLGEARATAEGLLRRTDVLTAKAASRYSRSHRGRPSRADRPAAGAREHGMHTLRHFYASALLDAGENIKAVSEYMGNADPGLTLRVYAHLMPDSRERARRAIDQVFGALSAGDDGPQTAQ
ncbi:tyrosine-type recombinase/integrase [Streptomyces sp. NPDC086554]|uniref:tyrosine-type recombinase/integrase n=1 Tax=Streptomyces sp. NPDC086554 TaxID=3154864 RepID=UPI0034251BD6